MHFRRISEILWKCLLHENYAERDSAHCVTVRSETYVYSTAQLREVRRTQANLHQAHKIAKSEHQVELIHEKSPHQKVQVTLPLRR